VSKNIVGNFEIHLQAHLFVITITNGFTASSPYPSFSPRGEWHWCVIFS
jgi:hypothetical protein